MLNQLTKVVVVFSLVLIALGGGVAHAFGSDSSQTHSLRQQNSGQLSNVLTPLRYSQNRQSNLRSRNDVMQEVKRRYDAKVLKITLNKQREIYKVRVLMPNGKVRSIQVSAKR